MKTVDLRTGWKVRDFAPGEGAAAALSAPDMDDSGWHEMSVPGDVNAALVRAGRMPSPHHGDNARQCYWVTTREWWMRRVFSARDLDLGMPVADLVMDGVDGWVDVYLNGEKICRTENAFRPYCLNIKDKIRPDGQNVLLLRFQALEEILGGPRKDDVRGWFDARVAMRKPQFNFGWDWSLALPSIGVMGYARIECHEGPRIMDASMQGLVCGRVDFKSQVNAAARAAGYELRVVLRGHGERHEKKLHRHWRRMLYASFHLKKPKLWWPNGMGEPALYDWEVSLVVKGKVMDSRRGRVGLREVKILESPFSRTAGPGIKFGLEVNGVPVFCKGANWIPMELWPAEVKDEDYRFYLEKTAEAGFNMQRVWGGGIYERDLFYELCDELGIMVWQDFMYAGAKYPVHVLRHEAIAEAEYQVKRLRNHACIALWCGCNEISDSWQEYDEAALTALDRGALKFEDMPEQTRSTYGESELYSMILRGTVSKTGFGVPFVESSPLSHDDVGNLPESGNSHISCWKFALFDFMDKEKKDKGADRSPVLFRKHFEEVCSFDSEFCIQGPCNRETLEQFLPREHRWPPDDMWTFHIQRGHFNLPHHEQTLMIAGGIFGEIDSLAKYVKHGQAAHVEMMRLEFESARRDAADNGGTMFWMFNDCWPTCNWSVIDYYRRPKPAYYAAKRACAPVLPIIFERGGNVEFLVSNHTRCDARTEVAIGLEDLDGVVAWSRKAVVNCKPGESKIFRTMSRAGLKIQPGQFLFIQAKVNGRRLPKTVYFPDGWKHINWPEPGIKLECLGRSQKNKVTRLRLRVSASRFARLCHVRCRDRGKLVYFSDNFFDLPAGTSREIEAWADGSLVMDGLDTGHWLTEWD